jgi:hypothetical protein
VRRQLSGTLRAWTPKRRPESTVAIAPLAHRAVVDAGLYSDLAKAVACLKTR